MYSDNDIKIAGDKPSLDVIKNRQLKTQNPTLDKKLMSCAKKWGREVADKFKREAVNSSIGEREFNIEMLSQRRTLLSFTASVGFEIFSPDDLLGGFAQKSFLDRLGQEPAGFVEDTGAFSFYYLAFRKGFDVERRIGQTFAMLCSHDGDPIYQEMGEALYCWFLSVVKDIAQQNGIL